MPIHIPFQIYWMSVGHFAATRSWDCLHAWDCLRSGYTCRTSSADTYRSPKVLLCKIRLTTHQTHHVRVLVVELIHYPLSSLDCITVQLLYSLQSSESHQDWMFYLPPGQSLDFSGSGRCVFLQMEPIQSKYWVVRCVTVFFLKFAPYISYCRGSMDSICFCFCWFV